MKRKPLFTPTRKWEFFFKSLLPSHAPVSTCWAEEVSDFQHHITTINAIKTFWLCEEDPSHPLDHHDSYVPTYNDPKGK